MHVLAIANHKGGVGKTTTTHALGVAYASPKCRVLMVDCDPQASLTGACGRPSEGPTLAQALGSIEAGSHSLADVIVPVGDNLSLVPSGPSLTQTDMGMAQRMGREAILKTLLGTVKDRYDLCLLDCPPFLNLLTINALTAANGIVVPTQAQCIDLLGLQAFLRTVQSVKQTLNARLKIYGIVLTFFDPRLRHHQEALQSMADGKLPVLKSRIGRSIRVAEASSQGESVLSFAPNHNQALAYRALAKEIQPWLQ